MLTQQIREETNAASPRLFCGRVVNGGVWVGVCVCVCSLCVHVCVCLQVHMCSGSDGAWRISACISTWAALRERYTGEKDGGTGSLRVRLCVCVRERERGEVGAANGSGV